MTEVAPKQAAPTHSALYEGTVRHRRFTPTRHDFRYRLFLAYLDLDELPGLFAGSRLAAIDRPALMWFRRADYLDGGDGPLDEAVRDLVAERTGIRPSGPIRMLTHLRSFGYVFNPITIYYCFDEGGERVDTVVLEVTNTPWGERHCYVLEVGGDLRTELVFAKELHVSPFMPMDLVYRVAATTPGERLWVRMALERAPGETALERAQGPERVFDADLVLRRVELSRRSLRRTLARHPLMTVRVTAAIHVEAVRLWLKRVPFVAHPRRKSAETATRPAALHGALPGPAATVPRIPPQEERGVA